MYFAKTYDRIGPLGAKSMSESPFNPVAAALANGICDATGVRVRETPFKADRLYRQVLDAAQAREVGRQPQVSLVTHA